MTKITLYGEMSAGATIVSIEGDDGMRVIDEFSRGATQDEYINGLADVATVLVAGDIPDYEGDEASLTGLTPILTHDTESDRWEIGNLDAGQSVEIVDALIILGILPADPDHEERTDDDARAIADVLRGCDYVCEYIARGE